MRIVKIDTDEHPEVSSQLQVLPTAQDVAFYSRWDKCQITGSVGIEQRWRTYKCPKV